MVKVLFNHHLPFSFAHGGVQIQIEQTKAALQQVGVQVEPLRWWDEKQTGDVLHHFGRLPTYILRAAHQKGMKVVLAELLTEAGSRSRSRLNLEKWIRQSAQSLSAGIFSRFSWDAYQLADACVAVTPWEATLLDQVFRAPRDKIHVVPNGVEQPFFESAPAQRGQWLVCTATITERKRIVELAEAAVIAETPLWLIGKPYSETSPYARKFLELAKQHSRILRYEGPVDDRARLAQIYREARGFVLLSAMESLSLSALEAAACGCPLLLSDLPWAQISFGKDATYCPVASPQKMAPFLKDFYQRAPNLPIPPRPLSWLDVAQRLKAIYEKLIS